MTASIDPEPVIRWLERSIREAENELWDRPEAHNAAVRSPRVAALESRIEALAACLQQVAGQAGTDQKESA